MRPGGRLSGLVQAFALTLVFLAAGSSVAKAEYNATVNEMADILEAVEDATGGIDWLPVSSGQIRDMGGLFNCLDRAVNSAAADLEIGKCVDAYEAQLGGVVGGIPSWVFDLVELYIAVRDGDFWGVVAKLGEAAICAIANIMAAGAVDVCALVEALIELGEAVYDAAVAVGEFFADLGEAVYEGAKAACEFVGLCSSDDPPPPPPELVAYNTFFHPRLTEGLNAMKSRDFLAFGRLKQGIMAQAREGWVTDGVVLLQMVFPEHAIRIAADIYTNSVDKLWTGDMISEVLPARRGKRLPYDDPNNVLNMAADALAGFEQGASMDPATNIPTAAGHVFQSCARTFTDTYAFAHVDRWIPSHPQEAASLHADTNRDWCRDGFFVKNRARFAEHFRDAVRSSVCSGDPYGGALLCRSAESYRRCLAIMGGLTGLEGECAVDMREMGREAAKRIVEEFRRRGSDQGTYACDVEVPAGTADPAVLDCPRPSQRYYCQEIYLQFYGGVDLPARLVDCRVTRSAAYRQLEGEVASAAAALESRHGVDLEVETHLDPLVVHVPDVGSLATIRPDVEAMGYLASLGLTRIIDGESTPVFLGEVPRVNEPLLTSPRGMLIIEDKVRVNPDPTQIMAVEEIVTSPTIAFSRMQRAPEPGFKSARMIPKASFGSARLPGGAVGPPGGFPEGTEMTPMMGSGPPGSGFPPRGVPKVRTAPEVPRVQGRTLGAALPQVRVQKEKTGEGPAPEIAPRKAPRAVKMPRSGLIVPATPKAGGPKSGRSALLSSARGPGTRPDLTAADKVVVGGAGAAWGGAVTLDGRRASRFEKGACVYPVGITVHNRGGGPAGSFRSALGGGAGTREKNWDGLGPGKSGAETGDVRLKPGKNTLTLTLDPDGAVDESSEENNIFSLDVTVKGPCGLVLRPVKPTVPMKPTIPVKPAMPKMDIQLE